MTKLLRFSLGFLICLAATVHVAAQRVVTGVVREKINSKILPGVTILVQGTTNGTSSNGNGSFKLTVPSQTTVLEVQMVGYKTQQITVAENSSKPLVILLKELCNLDFFYDKYVEFLFASGVKYTPLGGQIKLSYPYLFNANNMLPSLRAEAGYQTGANNYQRGTVVAIDDLIASCDVGIGVSGEYQAVEIETKQIKFVRWTGEVNYQARVWHQPILVGLGELNIIDDNKQRKLLGVEIGTKRTFFRRASLDATAKLAWWQNYWQFQAVLGKDTPHYSVGIRFNKLASYSEINLLVGIKLLTR